MATISKDQVISDARDAVIEVSGDSTPVTYGGETGLAARILDLSPSGNIGPQATFKVDGADYYIASCKNSGYITAPVNPTVTSGSFNGWKIGDTAITFPYAPSGNVTIVADITEPVPPTVITINPLTTPYTLGATHHSGGRMVYWDLGAPLNLQDGETWTIQFATTGTSVIFQLTATTTTFENNYSDYQGIPYTTVGFGRNDAAGMWVADKITVDSTLSNEGDIVTLGSNAKFFGAYYDDQTGQLMFEDDTTFTISKAPTPTVVTLASMNISDFNDSAMISGAPATGISAGSEYTFSIVSTNSSVYTATSTATVHGETGLTMIEAGSTDFSPTLPSTITTIFNYITIGDGVNLNMEPADAYLGVLSLESGTTVSALAAEVSYITLTTTVTE